MHPHELHQIWQMGGGAGVTNKELVQKLKNRRSRLMLVAAERILKLEAALERIRDTPHVVYEPVRQIAREALE